MKKPTDPHCISSLSQCKAFSSTFTSPPLSAFSWNNVVLCSVGFRGYCYPTVANYSMLPHIFRLHNYFDLDPRTVFHRLLSQALDLLSFLPSSSSPNLHLHQPNLQFSAFNSVLILKHVDLPCTLVLPQIIASLCANPDSFLTNSQFPHEWLFRNVDFLAHPYNHVVLASKFVTELRLLAANEGCEAQICKFGRYWCVRVLGSITVFPESVSSEYQIVKLQSAADNDATRHHETQISLLFLSSSLHHPLFYPSLAQFILAYLSYDDIKLYFMELGKRIKKEIVYCVDNYDHRLFFKAYTCILVDIELPISLYPVCTIWVQCSLSSLILFVVAPP